MHFFYAKFASLRCGMHLMIVGSVFIVICRGLSLKAAIEETNIATPVPALQNTGV
jgi:hypothetical protein